MTPLFEELGDQLAPGNAAKLSLQRELERSRTVFGDRGQYRYRGTGDLLLRHGTYFQGAVLPDEFDHLRGETTYCFLTSLQAVQQDPRLRLFEGVYSTGGGHFTAHGWVVAWDGRLLELTYPTKGIEGLVNDRGFEILPPAHWAYQGIEVHPDLVQWHLDNDLDLPMLLRGQTDLDYQGRWGLDMSQNHDSPLLKVQYDPQRRSL